MKQFDDVVFKVNKRKYEVDDRLKYYLKDKKKQSKLSNEVIASRLNVPKTMVEHWFRTDKYFSVPNKELWEGLKGLLSIDTDEFDDQITEFVEEDNRFDMGNRVYSTDVVCPTITANSEVKIYETTRENR